MDKITNKLILLLILTLLLTGCNKEAKECVWNNQNLNIDGFYADWGQNLFYNEKSNIGFGAARDSGSVYLCLVSADKEIIRQVMMRGLELSVNIPKTKKHMFTIKYPLGMEGVDMSVMRNMRSGRNTDGGARRRDISGLSDKMPPPKEIQTEFYLYGPGKDDRRIIPIKNTLGIDVCVGHTERQMIYEIQVPLRLIKEYFDMDSSVIISEMDLKFKMPEMEMPEMPSQDGMDGSPGGMGGGRGGRGAGMSGGGGGGMGGGPGGGMGGPPGGSDGMNSISKNFTFKVRISLANPEIQ